MTPETRDRSAITAKRTLLALAWPAVLSYLLNNSYRINDQFWIQGLGEPAQSAAGGVIFVLIMNFSVAFLAAGGTLSLVARAVGAGSTERVDRVTRHALGLSALIGLALTLIGTAATPFLVRLLGLEGEVAGHAEGYLQTLYWMALPMFLVPTLDSVFIGRGRTRIPMLLQGIAIGFNFLLNPLLIYGRDIETAMPDAPGVAAFAAVAEHFGIEGRGMVGAALATGLSRSLIAVLGLGLLTYLFGTRLVQRARPDVALLKRIVSVSAPMSLSVAMYAGVYWAILALVFGDLPESDRAGLGIGFQVFEGVAFPVYLGLAMAGASLVGQALGASDRDAAWTVVHNTRWFGRIAGVVFTIAFLVLAKPVGGLFTKDPEVLRAVVLYVTILAASQYWVAIETVNEKVLMGSGETKRIPWITGLGNGLRVPVGYALAVTLGLGAGGVYWAINATTWLKAGLFWLLVQRGVWVERLGADG